MSLEELKYFFSYTREDSEFVLRLTNELKAVGANVWLDQLSMLGGQHWDRIVEKALKSCKGMIVVLSTESVASDNVMDEVSYALDERKLVVPVLLSSCDIPLRLRRLHYVDFTADYEMGFSQLLRALHIEEPVQPLESAATQEPVVQEPSLPKQSESTPDAVDYSKPTDLETEKVVSKSRMAETLPPLTTDDIRGPLKDPSFSVYLYIGQLTDEGWENALLAFELRTRLRIYLVKDIALVREWVGQKMPKGIVFGWDDKPKRFLNKTQAEDFKVVMKAIREARK